MERSILVFPGLSGASRLSPRLREGLYILVYRFLVCRILRAPRASEGTRATTSRTKETQRRKGLENAQRARSTRHRKTNRTVSKKHTTNPSDFTPRSRGAAPLPDGGALAKDRRVRQRRERAGGDARRLVRARACRPQDRHKHTEPGLRQVFRLGARGLGLPAARHLACVAAVACSVRLSQQRTEALRCTAGRELAICAPYGGATAADWPGWPRTRRGQGFTALPSYGPTAGRADQRGTDDNRSVPRRAGVSSGKCFRWCPSYESRE